MVTKVAGQNFVYQAVSLIDIEIRIDHQTIYIDNIDKYWVLSI